MGKKHFESVRAGICSSAEEERIEEQDDSVNVILCAEHGESLED